MLSLPAKIKTKQTKWKNHRRSKRSPPKVVLINCLCAKKTHLDLSWRTMGLQVWRVSHTPPAEGLPRSFRGRGEGAGMFPWKTGKRFQTERASVTQIAIGLRSQASVHTQSLLPPLCSQRGRFYPVVNSRRQTVKRKRSEKFT